MDDEQLPPGTVLADRFRVVRQVGSGGMGSVYEIVHVLTEHRRALKLLNAEWMKEEDAVERFLREASAAGRIGNPHIVETFDAGRLPTGEPYLVMELLQGQTLAERLERGGVLPIDELIDLARQACEGVQAAHEAGIVHRDLKPENLYLIQREGRPFVKLLDFGVSKFSRRTALERSTVGRQFVGTPLYMSPEQLRGESVDGRTDVYALGVILYECATGTHPYPGGDLTSVIAQVLDGVRRGPVSKARPDLPSGLSEVVERAMERDREQRIPSPRALSLELALLGLQKREAEPAAGESETRPPREKAGSSIAEMAPPVSRAEVPSAVQAGSIVPPTATRRGPASQTAGSTLLSSQPVNGRAQPLLVAAGAASVLALGAAAWIALTPRSAAEPSSATAPPVERPIEPARIEPPSVAPQPELAPSTSADAPQRPRATAAAPVRVAPSAKEAASARKPTPHDLAGKGEFRP